MKRPYELSEQKKRDVKKVEIIKKYSGTCGTRSKCPAYM